MTKDTEIQLRHRERMKAIAGALDEYLNPRGKPVENCFVLLISPFGTENEGPRCNYISNGKREDVLCLLKEMVARFEGQTRNGGKRMTIVELPKGDGSKVAIVKDKIVSVDAHVFDRQCVVACLGDYEYRIGLSQRECLRVLGFKLKQA